ncbi:ribokinase [Clostridium taeniosporum]|uniref:Ribokinase n=1 Tax=Clostridium taeniosporum TaxID=394958 RepID=A0A1D7XJ83_9CLOT|nr:ribokinase [Clostridium taeniosporum]AOR23398.1 ribokinase [Clostridium taeniosporum]
MNRICVLGSMNMDLVMKIKDMPKSGETILSKSYEKIPGGKGANQAVAAKRSGAYVSMIAKIGQDDYGRTLRDELRKDDINIDYVFEDESNATGTAIIMVTDSGNNSIIVNSGSNMSISETEIDLTLERIKESDILIAQFETTVEMSLRAFKNAKENRKITILNPAPAKKIDDGLLKVTDIIVPNETEAEALTGVTVENIKDAKKAAKAFMDKGVKFVIITMGSKGAAVIGKDFCELVPAYKVNAIDTTAAGDSFIGGLSTKLNPNEITKENILKAVKFGNMVSSIAVQREGAQPSIPYKEEVIKVYGEE